MSKVRSERIAFSVTPETKKRFAKMAEAEMRTEANLARTIVELWIEGLQFVRERDRHNAHYKENGPPKIFGR